MMNEMLKDLETMLQNHDWTYGYSDDPRWYRDGQASWERIQGQMARCKMAGLAAEAKTLYETYYNKVFGD